MQRVDVSLCSYRFSPKQLIEITKKVVSAVVIVSSVNVACMTNGTIRVLVQNQSPEDTQKEILHILLKAHEEALPASS